MMMRRLFAACSAILVCTAFAGGLARAENRSWGEITSAASGQTVYWNAWGGSPTYNAYMAWAGAQIKARHGVDMVHVKLGDTAEAVRAVLADKTAGRDSGGAIDLIWINGENFRSMKEADLLYGPFTDKLPNFSLVDPAENPATVLDFTVPVEGFESPWGAAQLVFIHDSARLPAPPRSIAALLDHARAHPGRIAFPAPPDFTGSTMLKQILYGVTGDRAALLQPPGDNFAAVTAPLWAYLDEIKPFLWRQGAVWPASGAELVRMLDDGEVDIAMSFNLGEAPNAIAEGRLPDSARTFVLEGGTIGNVHFVAIPFNARNKEGAMVLANFLLSPEAQARKQNPQYWGEGSVLSLERLSPADRRLFADLPRSPAALPPEAQGKILPEPHPDWMVGIEEEWQRRYGG